MCLRYQLFDFSVTEEIKLRKINEIKENKYEISNNDYSFSQLRY